MRVAAASISRAEYAVLPISVFAKSRYGPSGSVSRRRASASSTVVWGRVVSAMRYLTVASGRGAHRRADHVGVLVAGPEMRVEQPRALQVEVHVDLPREAHAAVHLRRGLG